MRTSYLYRSDYEYEISVKNTQIEKLQADVLQSLDHVGSPSGLSKSKFENLSNDLVGCFATIQEILKIDSESLRKTLRLRRSNDDHHNIFQDMDSISQIVSELSKALVNMHQDQENDFDVCVLFC